MSLLGTSGTLTFTRPAVETLILDSHDRRETSNTFQPSSHGLWTGDYVELSNEGGVPLPPYYETCFVHVDRLGRLSLYTSKQEALAGIPDTRLLLPEAGACPINLRPLLADYDVITKVGDWVLHTDPVYLNEALIERQLGTGMTSLCECGGQLSFVYSTENARAFTRDLVTMYNLLNNGEKLEASLDVVFDDKHRLIFSMKLDPLAYVINYRDIPRVEGTIDFACTDAPGLRQV